MFFTCKKIESICEECKDEEKTVPKAKEIAEQYEQLGKCCDVISSVQKRENYVHEMYMYTGGWRVMKSCITNAGIDIEEVYSYIEKLARKRKAELELELGKLEV